MASPEEIDLDKLHELALVSEASSAAVWKAIDGLDANARVGSASHRERRPGTVNRQKV